MAFWAQGRVDSEVRVAGHVGSRTCWVRIALWGHLVAGRVPSHDGNDLSDPPRQPCEAGPDTVLQKGGTKGEEWPRLTQGEGVGMRI